MINTYSQGERFMYGGNVVHTYMPPVRIYPFDGGVLSHGKHGPVSHVRLTFPGRRT